MAQDKKPQELPSGQANQGKQVTRQTQSGLPDMYFGPPEDVPAPYDTDSPQRLARGSDRNSKTLEVGSYQSSDFIDVRDNAAGDKERQGWRLKARGGADGLANVFIGDGAPSSTPTHMGDIYVDYTTPHVYISTGTSSSSDWLQVG